jgi:hypothetical protein
MFTRRPWDHHSSATVDASSGTAVYLIIGGGQAATRMRDSASAAGWVRIGDASIRDGKGTMVFGLWKKVPAEAMHVTLPGGGLSGVLVVARAIETGGNDNNGGEKHDEPAEPTTTLHIDATPDTTPLLGPCTRPAHSQASINALEVYNEAHGLMLGETTEETLTLTGSATPKAVAAHFITKVGGDTCLARDEAIRYIRLKYPNWYVSDAAITFEDKYVAHEGGSGGTAVATMILSCIEGFDIDPDAAITGDISANGKTRQIGGVSAKIKGAIAGKCKVVCIPMENIEQLTDGVLYNGPGLVEDIQVLGINNLDEAVADVRVDRDPKLQEAMMFFALVQKRIRTSPEAIHSKDTQADLQRVLDLVPDHLSAQVLLAIANGTAPKTLSAGASEYYTYLAIGNMEDALKERGESTAAPAVPSSLVRTELASLRKLRPMADESVRPLIDAWVRFIGAWNEQQEGFGSAQSVEEQRQAVIDDMAKENADADLMQKMLKQGM